MPRLVEYQCVDCGEVYEEMFGDTEEHPKELEKKCECGGTFKKGLNLKKNSQCWRVHGL